MKWSALSKTQQQEALALLAIRLASAAAFIYHGLHILGVVGGPGIANFAKFTGLPVPLAFLVGFGELCGGLAMLTGVLARLGAAVIALIMAGAIVMFHWQHGFDILHQGYEYALTQLLIALAILIRGAGPLSLVELLRATKTSPESEVSAPSSSSATS